VTSESHSSESDRGDQSTESTIFPDTQSSTSEEPVSMNCSLDMTAEECLLGFKPQLCEESDWTPFPNFMSATTVSILQKLNIVSDESMSHFVSSYQDFVLLPLILILILINYLFIYLIYLLIYLIYLFSFFFYSPIFPC
jgi:hypothetical protein